ncbi:AzlC family ABC transporter permease [Roseibium salinum]|uniref:AzlC family ABC transporter permease n=1 Tax=Roseibium salinum TaxID=1604349 RepID=A0ABT3QZS8_9HYPH|nr:AzlC family ABC transporter permease [Roseibium sp. DSM 29163]MCX2722464.1 AzlC family ABC transporter permease [Roseibium sp. DSM 29163]
MTVPERPAHPSTSAAPTVSGKVWMLRGARSAVSIPAFILTAAFVGYASLARETGLTIYETLAMTGFIWALPSVVVLTGALSSGMGLIPAAIAVALASVRLMPMTMALMPLVKVPGKTRNWQLLIASHFVAVTAWVYAMKHLPDLPKEGRLPFFVGFGGAVSSFVFCMTGIAYLLVERMPDMVAGALFLLTPIYFLCSLWGASRLNADRVAMLAGLVFGPLFFVYLPGLDLLWTGLAGGTLAYAGTRVARRGLS